jgi:hypothetical protein
MRLKRIGRVVMDKRLPDIEQVMCYRPKLFGKHFLVAVHEVMRGPSSWSAGERELFAAFVSSKNRCQY